MKYNVYAEGTFGTVMSKSFVSVKRGCTVREAMRTLVKGAADTDNISTVFVVDGRGLLVGGIDLKTLIIAREQTPTDSIIRSDIPFVLADAEIDDSVQALVDCEEDLLPVLDSRGVLVGVLGAHTVTELVDDSLGEDYAMLAGLQSEEDITGPILKSVVKRLPWLAVLLGLGLVVSGVVAAFESVVAELAMIVSFQSLVLGMSGNVGTQSLAVTIRILGDPDIDLSKKLRLVGKELRVGLLCGITLGLLSFLLIGSYIAFVRGESTALAFSVSACTGAALVISMTLSAVTGSTVPMLFERLGVDPAVASGPLITTVNDLVAVVSYYGLAWLFLLQI